MTPNTPNHEKSDTVRVNVTLDRELDKRFREAVVMAMGYKKGNLQTAMEEALEVWIQEKVKERKSK